MAADNQRWQVYIMPAQPTGGAIWSGSFKAKPSFEIRNAIMHIKGDDAAEPELVVSMATALSVMLARSDYIEAWQPQPPLTAPAPTEASDDEGF